MAVKQQIPSSTNAPKTLNFAKLRGVDFSTSPFEVASTRATDMKNLINEDGVNHKRPGWTENIELYQALGNYNKNLTGLYKIKENVYLVFNETSGVIYDTNNKFIVQEVPISTIIGEENKIKNVKFEKISTEKTLIIIKFTESKDEFIFFNATFKPITRYEFNRGLNYAPKTTISINSDEDATATRESFEEPSLTTAWRINTLISPEKTVRLTIKLDIEDKNLRFLDITYQAGEYQSVTGFEFQSLSEITLAFKPEIIVRILGIGLVNPQTSQPVIVWDEYKIEDKDGNAITSQTEIEMNEDKIIYIKEAD